MKINYSNIPADHANDADYLSKINLRNPWNLRANDIDRYFKMHKPTTVKTCNTQRFQMTLSSVTTIYPENAVLVKINYSDIPQITQMTQILLGKIQSAQSMESAG